jgi:hypothetical protein
MKIRDDEPFEVIVYFRKVFLLSKFKYFCFVAILEMSLISRWCKNDHIIFNVGTPSLEARNIRLVNIITYIIEESFDQGLWLNYLILVLEIWSFLSTHADLCIVNYI